MQLHGNDTKTFGKQILLCKTDSLVYTNIFIQDYTIAKYILIKSAFLYRLVDVKRGDKRVSNHL